MPKRVLCMLLCLVVLCAQASCALTREEIRAAWQQISAAQDDSSPYLLQPDTASFSAGDLTENARQNALEVLNFLREIAGVDVVELSDLYNLRAQNGALLLAANDFLEHNAPQPAGMDNAQYESAHLGTSLGNIAKFSWMRPEILIDGVTYFARDDGEENLNVLGHRRWLLNPEMSATGFGLANSASAASYVTMYAVDDGNADAQWDYVAWPAEGCFPVEMMRRELAWSVSVNDEIYDIAASGIEVYIKEETSGYEAVLRSGSDENVGFCTISTEECGDGSCIIFRPNVRELDEYVQNQVWQVEITGLKKHDGEDARIAYTVNMVSLYAQEVANIELSQLEANLEPSEALQLHADVIPAYADDTSVIWGSNDPNVASVNAQGLVTAVGKGTCSITAMSGNGKKDVCTITVG